MGDKITKKILFWIVILFLLFAFPVLAGPDFFPSDHINLEGRYNITNISRVYADAYCFNNNTCFTITDLDVVEVDSMWAVALIMSLIGTAFLFVYISRQIGSNAENSNSIMDIFYNAMKLLLILGAFILPVIAIQANPAIWSAGGISDTRLSIYSEAASKIAIWVPTIFVSLLVVFMIIAYIIKVFQKKKDEGEGKEEE